MKELFEALRAALDRGEGAVLCTIVASSGSAPRGAGAKMAVFADGACRGTIGGGAVIVRACPDYVDAGEAEATLLELAAGLLEERRTDPQGVRDHLMATMACKAAIKGGQRNGPAELERVAAAVLAGEVQYCPHGRPVAVELTRGQLEKLFKRA